MSNFKASFMEKNPLQGELDCTSDYLAPELGGPKIKNIVIQNLIKKKNTNNR